MLLLDWLIDIDLLRSARAEAARFWEWAYGCEGSTAERQ
jgi:hypothetical protein